MAHILAKLRAVGAEEIKKVLQADTSKHAEQGLYLEHIWQNADEADEVSFLFRTDDLQRARQFIEQVHAQARKENLVQICRR